MEYILLASLNLTKKKKKKRREIGYCSNFIVHMESIHSKLFSTSLYITVLHCGIKFTNSLIQTGHTRMVLSSIGLHVKLVISSFFLFFGWLLNLPTKWLVLANTRILKLSSNTLQRNKILIILSLSPNTATCELSHETGRVLSCNSLTKQEGRVLSCFALNFIII